ncbi:hypothetical protein [Terribacillus saccharophilus]|uniref:hypothetical protein n=1 Tax=Terribacillus saccharophilus TaxID=361277 RepID=UPI002989DB52|nr:hypothetical protein [Terribacillus saccharophilus]MCM3227499.1 hypothetical protein [Terribacillus saccharophilus]
MYYKHREGEQIKLFDSIYRIDKIYQLSDVEVKKRNLVHKKRVKLVKIEGENGDSVMDFGIPEK